MNIEESEKIRLLIREAIQKFGFSQAEYKLVRHNENITCKVMDGRNAYSLRIHHPVEGFNADLLYREYSSRDYIQGEADLLVHMRKHGFPELQEPLVGTDGNYIQILSDGSPAMLLRWLEGRTITKEEGSRYTDEIGKMAVRIHQASKGFKGIRIQYDEEMIDRLMEEICAAAENGHLTRTAAGICIGELGTIRNAIDRLYSEDRDPGIIHADLGFENILLTEKGLIPIDFSLSGYGCHAQEAGMILSDYQKEEDHRNVLEGFRQGGEEIDKLDAKLFLSLSVLMFICAQHEKYHGEQWFQDAITRWCRDLFTHGDNQNI